MSGVSWSTMPSILACRPPSRIRIPVHSGDIRVDVQSALAMLAPAWGMHQLLDISDEQARDDLARASVMALSFVAQSARGTGPADGAAAPGGRGQDHHRAVHDPLARRPRPQARQGDRRLLDLRGRARHERLDLHGAGDRVDRGRRGGRAVRRRRRDVRPAARRRPRAGACT